MLDTNSSDSASTSDDLDALIAELIKKYGRVPTMEQLLQEKEMHERHVIDIDAQIDELETRIARLRLDHATKKLQALIEIGQELRPFGVDSPFTQPWWDAEETVQWMKESSVRSYLWQPQS